MKVNIVEHSFLCLLIQIDKWEVAEILKEGKGTGESLK